MAVVDPESGVTSIEIGPERQVSGKPSSATMNVALAQAPNTFQELFELPLSAGVRCHPMD